MKILVTGAAGFIGFHLVGRLIRIGHDVIGLDNLNNYYDVNLKYSRLEEAGILKENLQHNEFIKSSKYNNYRFIQLDIEDKENLNRLFQNEKIDKIINLAAQAGVKYSLKNPDVYISTNISGFLNILEVCKQYENIELIYASSSSVYGENRKKFHTECDNVDSPVSLYAVTKKTNELMAHTYSHLYNIKTVGLRFFTAYGPWGRPDMALHLFVKAIFENKYINIFNKGEMSRDFTYIDDIIEGIIAILYSEREDYYKIYNIGNGKPVYLTDFIKVIEDEIGIKAEKNYLPMQPGDVVSTHADMSAMNKDCGYKAKTSIKEGVKKYISWYKKYY